MGGSGEWGGVGLGEGCLQVGPGAYSLNLLSRDKFNWF